MTDLQFSVTLRSPGVEPPGTETPRRKCLSATLELEDMGRVVRAA